MDCLSTTWPLGLWRKNIETLLPELLLLHGGLGGLVGRTVHTLRSLFFFVLVHAVVEVGGLAEVCVQSQVIIRLSCRWRGREI